METDFSKIIYDKYYNVQDRAVVITLQDDTQLEGRLVSFFHGDPEDSDPFIVKWHFVEARDLDAYCKGLESSLDGGRQMIGSFIFQKDIKDVRFREIT